MTLEDTSRLLLKQWSGAVGSILDVKPLPTCKIGKNHLGLWTSSPTSRFLSEALTLSIYIAGKTTGIKRGLYLIWPTSHNAVSNGSWASSASKHSEHQGPTVLTAGYRPQASSDFPRLHPGASPAPALSPQRGLHPCILPSQMGIWHHLCLPSGCFLHGSFPSPLLSPAILKKHRLFCPKTAQGWC